MKVYLRSVSKSKWMDRLNKYKNDKVIGAHPVVKDLPADTNDTLSFWEVDESDNKSIEDIVLTLVNLRDKKGALDIILLPQDKVLEKEIEMKKVMPKNHMCDCGDKHYDFINLSIDNIHDLSKIIFEILSKDENAIKRYSVPDITMLFAKRVENKEIVIEDIIEDFRNNIVNFIKLK